MSTVVFGTPPDSAHQHFGTMLRPHSDDIECVHSHVVGSHKLEYQDFTTVVNVSVSDPLFKVLFGLEVSVELKKCISVSRKLIFNLDYHVRLKYIHVPSELILFLDTMTRRYLTA